MHADQPPSSRNCIHCVLTDLAPGLCNTPDPEYRFSVHVTTHPSTSGRRNISLEGPLDASAEGADDAVWCAG